MAKKEAGEVWMMERRKVVGMRLGHGSVRFAAAGSWGRGLDDRPCAMLFAVNEIMLYLLPLLLAA